MRKWRLLALGACVAGLGWAGVASAHSSANPAIAYSGYTNATHGPGTGTIYLFVMDADGSNQTAVWTYDQPHGASWAIGFPKWSPDGKHILFTYAPDGNGSANVLMEVDVAVTNGKVKGSNARTILDLSGQGRHVQAAAWSPNGAEMVFTSEINTSPMVGSVVCTQVLDTHGNPVGSANALYTLPSGILAAGGLNYSPDGTRFATVQLDPAVTTDGREWIAVIDHSGNATSLLTNTFYAIDNPFWSNPGKNLLFFGAFHRPGSRMAFTLDPSTPGAAPVNIPAVFEGGPFSPDNSKAAVVEFSMGIQIYDFRTGRLTMLVGWTNGTAGWRP